MPCRNLQLCTDDRQFDILVLHLDDKMRELRRQFKLLGRCPRQTLELIQIKRFDFLARPIRLFKELYTGINARIFIETIDIQIGE